MPRFLAALTPWLVVVILFIVGYSLDNSCIIPAVWSVEPSLITMISYSLCEISCCNADNTHFLICFSALYAGIMIEIFMALIIICLKKDDIIYCCIHLLYDRAGRKKEYLVSINSELTYMLFFEISLYGSWLE